MRVTPLPITRHNNRAKIPEALADVLLSFDVDVEAIVELWRDKWKDDDSVRSALDLSQHMQYLEAGGDYHNADDLRSFLAAYDHFENTTIGIDMVPSEGYYNITMEMSKHTVCFDLYIGNHYRTCEYPMSQLVNYVRFKNCMLLLSK